MQEQKKGYQFSTGFIVGLSSVILVAGGLGAWWAWTTIRSGEAPPWVPEQLRQTEQPSEKDPTSTPAEEVEVQVYWLQVTENREELVAQSIALEETSDPEAALEKAFANLMQGVDNPDYASTIPPSTELRDVSVRENGVHINLSEDFVFGGGSVSMIGRLGQVVYTATSFDPEAKVWLNVEGEPLEYLGGEGVKVPQPLTREEFNANYPLGN